MAYNGILDWRQVRAELGERIQRVVSDFDPDTPAISLLRRSKTGATVRVTADAIEAFLDQREALPRYGVLCDG